MKLVRWFQMIPASAHQMFNECWGYVHVNIENKHLYEQIFTREFYELNYGFGGASFFQYFSIWFDRIDYWNDFNSHQHDSLKYNVHVDC